MNVLPMYKNALELRFPGRKFPAFDPNDGGKAARFLIVLQDPKMGITKVSRDNLDRTAKNIRKYFSGIPRNQQIMWNAIPYFLNGETAPTGMAERKCYDALLELIRQGEDALLPKLEVVLFCGNPAKRARAYLVAGGHQPANVEFLETCHPGDQGLGPRHQREHFFRTVEELTRRFQGPIFRQ